MPPKTRSNSRGALTAAGASISSTAGGSRLSSRPSSSSAVVRGDFSNTGISSDIVGAGRSRPSSSSAVVREDFSNTGRTSGIGGAGAECEEIEGVPWSRLVSIPQACRRRGASVPQTECRGTTLGQILDLEHLVQRVVQRANIRDARAAGHRILWEDVNMYHIDEHFVRPLTTRFFCSWMELVSDGPQLPHWFVSHWWGTPFQQTVALLKFHGLQRHLPSDTAYWICTFANNQHDLSELGGSLRETPFVKAILAPHCSGTLTLLDHNVTTFERIWCVLENFVSSIWTTIEDKPSPHLLDVAAYLPAGSGTFGGHPVPAKPTLRMDMGNGKMKEQVEDEASGGAFPLTVSVKGSRIDIFRAQASRPEDRRNILHLIAGTPEVNWEETDPPKTSEHYDGLNKKVRTVFAAGAMYAAAARPDVEELESLLSEFPDFVNEGISDGATPVYAAAWKNHVHPLQLLLRRRGDPNRLKEDGASPLFIAAQVGHKEAIVELLEAKADPNIARDSVTPSFMAVQNKHSGALSALLEAEADPNIPNSQGVTPVLLAAQQGSQDLVKSLLAARADANRASNNGNTPVRVAKKNAIVKSLLEAKADPQENARPCERDIMNGMAELVDMVPESTARPSGKAKPKAKHRRGSNSGPSLSQVSGATRPAATSLIGMYAACEM